MQLTLVSHRLCPYVQRVAIVLLEKGVPFTRRWVDLQAKPAWFTALSPLGKTPVLLVGEQALFESAVICEYLDEVLPPRLHPQQALERATQRAWVAFGSQVLDAVAAYYGAPDEDALVAHAARLRAHFAQVERALAVGGTWFAGVRFGLVDAAFAPVFRYFDAFEAGGQRGWFDDLPRVRRWRAALAGRASVHAAVTPDFAGQLRAFLHGRGSALARRLQAHAAAALAAPA